MYETIPDLLSDLSEKYHHRIALQIRRFLQTTKFTYLEVEDLAKKVATYLHEEGIKPTDTIVIWAPNMPEWVLALFGSLTLGAVVVPVNLHSTPGLVEKYLDQTKPKAIFLSKFYPVDFTSKNLKKIYLEDLIDLVEDIKPKGLPRIHKNGLAEIVFTSGTTGEPKGVMITHHNIIYELDEILKTIPHDPEYRLLSILPLSHVMEQVGLFVALSRGATLYYVPRINLVTMQKALKKYHITHLALVPQIMRIFLDQIQYRAAQKGKEHLFKLLLQIAPVLPFPLRRSLFGEMHQKLGGKLFFFAVASAPLDLGLAQSWEAMGIRVVEGYGASETTGAVTDNRLGKRRLGSVGQKLPGVEVEISPEGEILAKGDNVTQGYFQNEEKTKESFTPDGYFKTGDIGQFDKKGYLYITGREKFKIVTAAGDKIYPEDIERKINAHPDVWDSCVLGLKKGDGEIVHAVVIRQKSAKKTLEQVVKEVNEKLESHQKILDFSFWPEADFPRLHTLKVDRNKVKEFLESQSNKTPAPEPIKDEADKLKELVSRTCHYPVEKINEDSRLTADLNLDSLKRVELVSLIEEEFGKEISEELIEPSTTYSRLKELVKQSPSIKADENLENVAELSRRPLIQNLKLLLQNLFMLPLFRLFVRTELISDIGLGEIPSSAVFVGNHPRTAAILCLIQALPTKVRKRLVILANDWFWRKNYLKIGNNTVCALVGALPLNKEGGAIRRSLELIADFLDDGYSIVILPEGDNTPPGQVLGKMQPGLSHLFADTKIPLIPFYISKDILHTFPQEESLGDYIPHGHSKLTLRIGRPFDLKGIFDSDVDEKVRHEILKLTKPRWKKT